MTAALNYLARITDELFASQMQRVAERITERERYFHRHATQR